MDPGTEVSMQNISDQFHISSFHREDTLQSDEECSDEAEGEPVPGLTAE